MIDVEGLSYKRSTKGEPTKGEPTPGDETATPGEFEGWTKMHDDIPMN
jgi:hypothetical protein